MDWIVCTAVGTCLRNVLRGAASSEQARKQSQILKHESKEVENETKKKKTSAQAAELVQRIQLMNIE